MLLLRCERLLQFSSRLSFLFLAHVYNRLELTDADEFIILGCDGIWDCLTNEKAVEFVRSRIQTMSPTEIGVEMLKTIISDDPRSTQGIGGDNMTIMIVDLQPNQRSYSGGVSSTTQPAATAVSK